MTVDVEPRSMQRTTCDLCNTPMVTVPGPSNGTKRLRASTGFRIGYIVEFGDRSFPVCAPCLRQIINPD